MGLRFHFPSRQITYSFAATSLATILQISAYVMPFWVTLHTHAVNVFVGLFFMLVCPTAAAANCISLTYESIMSAGYSGDERSAVEALYMVMLIIKIVAGIACGIIIAGFSMLLAAACEARVKKSRYQTVCATQIVSALLALGVTAFTVMMTISAATASPEATGLPWSVMAMGIGGFASLVSFAIMCNVLCNWEVPRTDGQVNMQMQAMKS